MGRMPVVGLLGTPGGLLLAEHDLNEAIEVFGENTGNLMFQYACWTLIQNPRIAFTFRRMPPIGMLRENIDVLCIPAANQLNPAWDLGWWADFIEKLDKPVVIAGLGIQGLVDQEGSITLRPGTERFLHTVANRAVHVGVRGPSTLRLLERYGVKNGVVTGCPSNFINPRVTGSVITERIARLAEIESPRVNYLFGTMEEFARPTEKELFTLCRDHAVRIVYQTNRRFFELIHTGVATGDTAKYLSWERKILAPDMTDEEYVRFILDRGRFYVDVKTWIDEVGRDDLSLGMRIHGAVAAVQGGSLGVCVAFDARTLELARTMGYPYVLTEDLKRMTSLRELPSAIEFSESEFTSIRTELRQSLKLAMEHHGVLTTL